MSRKSLALLGLISAMMCDPAIMAHGQSRGREFEPEDIPDPKIIIPKGCKEYTFDGITVIAISEKSAKRKVLRLKNKEGKNG